MIVGSVRETGEHEPRVGMTPESVAKLTKAGLRVCVERGIGETIGRPDAMYEAAGAELADDAGSVYERADIIVRVGEPTSELVQKLASGKVHAGFLNPFAGGQTVDAFAGAGVTSVSLELMPRTTTAQKMDALSSQHSLSGYYMVLAGAERLGKILPMMSTPAGTIQPARVLVIGAGVAGLQAIATARRLGARVEAFDTRPVVKEQVESLGAKFLEIDLGDTGQTEQGYARELTDRQKAMQQEGMAKAVGEADIVITTAQLFGRPAPRVVTGEMIRRMKPGSVVVDYAVETGGNVEGSVPGEDVRLPVDGGHVTVVGLRNYPGRMARDASLMLASNLTNFVLEFWEKPRAGKEGEEDTPGRFTLDERYESEDEIARGCIVTRGGSVVHPLVLEKRKGGKP